MQYSQNTPIYTQNSRLFHKIPVFDIAIKSAGYKNKVSFLHRENTGSKIVGINKGRGTI